LHTDIYTYKNILPYNEIVEGKIVATLTLNIFCSDHKLASSLFAETSLFNTYNSDIHLTILQIGLKVHNI